MNQFLSLYRKHQESYCFQQFLLKNSNWNQPEFAFDRCHDIFLDQFLIRNVHYQLLFSFLIQNFPFFQSWLGQFFSTHWWGVVLYRLTPQWYVNKCFPVTFWPSSQTDCHILPKLCLLFHKVHRLNRSRDPFHFQLLCQLHQ